MSCFVKNCGNYPYKKSIRNMRFFRFPSDKSLFRKWVKACGIEVNERQDNMRVCQNHFADEDYRLQDILLKTDLMKRRLKPGAVPSKNLPPRINSIESREECNHELKGETEHIAIESNSCETICCVKSCFSTKKCGKISFFKFPEDVNRKQEWEKLLKLENDLANEMEICSMHFKKKYLIEEGEHLTLSEDAIPTIRVGPPITEKIEKGIKLPESKKKIQQPSKMQKPYKMPIMFVSCSTLGEENDEDDENIGLLSLKNKILQQSGKFKNSNAPLKLKKTLELTSETKTNSPLTEYITSTAFVFGSNVDENDEKHMSCPTASDVETQPLSKKFKPNQTTLKQCLESSSDTDDYSSPIKNSRRKAKLKVLKKAFLKITKSNMTLLKLVRKSNERTRKKNKKILKLKNKISELNAQSKEVIKEGCSWCLS